MPWAEQLDKYRANQGILSPTIVQISSDFLHWAFIHLNTTILGFYKLTFKVNCILKEKNTGKYLMFYLNISP